MHKASFGDQLPKPGAKPVGWEPGQDILFGSMSFTNLQTNVAKLGSKKQETSANEHKDEKSLDEKLQMLKNDERIESNSESESNKSNSLHNTEKFSLNENQMTNMLPDVVQDHGRVLDRKVESDQNNLTNIDLNSTKADDILADLTQLKIESNMSGIRSPKSVGSSMESKGSKPSSISASPAHSSREVSSSPKPDSLSSSSSLAELQDPSKFTIGTDKGKKKKISKMDFEKGSTGPKEVDPNDPLGSLDPLWSLK